MQIEIKRKEIHIMIYFLLILIFTIIIILLCGYYQTKIYKALNMPITPPPLDDSIALAKEIGNFLYERDIASGRILSGTYVSTHINQTRINSILIGKEMAVIDFIRICKLLGCEVIVKQVA